MRTEAILFLITFVLLIVLLLMLFMGCSCFVNQAEGFSNGPRVSIANPTAPETQKPAVAGTGAGVGVDNDDDEDGATQGPVTLTPAETELFEDLRNNRLTSKQIHDMVQANILTTSVVEKFMKKLEENYQGETILNPLDKKKQDTHEEEPVEGFCSGDSYSPW